MTESVSSLEKDIEATREQLAATIDQLVYRANPKTIASRQQAQVKAYFVDHRGEPRTDNIVKVVGGVVGTIALLVIVRKLSSGK